VCHMGERIYANQPVLQNSLNHEFMRLYLSISNACNKYGHSPKCSHILKQFAAYFYRQTIQKKQYKTLRSQMIRNTLMSGTSQKCEIFSDEKINGYLYALPSKNAISSTHLTGNINMLIIDHGAIQIEKQLNHKFTMPSQRLTTGQSTISIKEKDTQTSFRAKTNVSIFLCVSCNESNI